jgi:gamma-tubulin complex component 2
MLYFRHVFKCDIFISDPSLHEMVKQILPLASHYSMVMRFIQEKSQFECGQVNHALTAAMNTLIKDYMVLVAQLETANRKGNFSVHKLWFFIQPTLHTMEILANIASTISKVSLQETVPFRKNLISVTNYHIIQSILK